MLGDLALFMYCTFEFFYVEFIELYMDIGIMTWFDVLMMKYFNFLLLICATASMYGLPCYAAYRSEALL